METVIAVGMAALLICAAAMKAAAPSSRAEAASFGVRGSLAQWLAWGGAIAAELAVAVLLILGVDAALAAAGALFGAFAVLHAAAIRRGAAGQRCGCFGKRGVVSWGAVARNAALAVVAFAAWAAVALDPSERTLVITGFAVLGLLVAALAVAVVALAREVGIMRLAMQSGGALEIPEEGPPLGARVEIGRWFETAGRDVALAVFSSAACPVCRGLSASVEFVARDPRIAVLVFDEHDDADAWAAFDAPGAPYAVALDSGGRVLAKGVVNSLPQLESVIATAVRRRAESAGV